MKLLCIIPSYFPAFQFGGPIYSVHGLNKALARKGVDISVYTTNVGLGDTVPVNEAVNVDGVKVIYFKFTKFFEILGATGWQFSWELTHALKKNLKSFDLVYLPAVWNYPTTVTAFYCRKYRKPYIIAPRGVLYPYTMRKNVWKKWPYYKLFAKKDLKGAAAIHYTTEDEAEKCHSSLGLENRAVIIPNGIDMSEFNDLPPKENLRKRYPVLKDKKVLLFLGRIHWIKGLDILVKAYDKLAKEMDDVHLLIVGNDEEGYGEKVKGWIKAYGLNYEDYGLEQEWGVESHESESGASGGQDDENVKVTFTGMLTGEEKIEAFAGSDLFVLPSYSENFGMAAVEAMACGLPVIISDQVGIHKEITKVNAGVVIETNVDQLVKAMKNLLDNPLTCKEMGKNGWRLVREKFVWDKVAEQMFQLYKSMVDRPC